jgi:WhiB family transcriptional regulator, redox-sensing transcriptional regulator
MDRENVFFESDRYWQEQAACRDKSLVPNNEIFFPVGEKIRTEREKIEKAKAVCGQCAVRTQCLEYALVYEDNLIWGGTTEDERRVILRRRNTQRNDRRFRA